jgi:hypothetical protein
MLYVEECNDGEWTYAGALAPTTPNAPREPQPPELAPEPLYCHRTYEVFAILADVRNGEPPWRAPFTPIAAPRGLPTDLSPELIAWAEYCEGAIQSPNWLTLQEILGFDWEGRTNCAATADGERTATYAEVAQDFLDQVVRRLQRRGVPAEDVRLVFWFC